MMKYIKVICLLMIASFSLQAQSNLKGIIQKDFSGLKKEKSYHSITEKWGLNTSINFTNDDCNKSGIIDLAFLVDATSSMDDQIDFLKAEIKKTILEVQKKEGIQFRTGSVFYRDVEEEYQVKSSKFSNDLNQTIQFIDQQRAAGGGDYPEDFSIGFQEAVNLNWSEKADAKLLFVFCDAPPHENTKSLLMLQQTYELAAANGISIFPVLGTAADFNTEVIMKTLANKSKGAVISLQKENTPNFEQADFLVDIVHNVLKNYANLEDCDPEKSETSKVFVYGNIMDAFSKGQLIGANLTIQKNNAFYAGIVSDLDGFYTLQLEPGVYDFKFSYMGFQDDLIKKVIVGHEDELKINGNLNPGINLETVIVSCYGSICITERSICTDKISCSNNCLINYGGKENGISEITKTEIKKPKSNNTALSPNPANSYVNISATNPFKAIKIFSSDGKLVFQEDNILDIRTKIQLNNWSAGMYLVYYFFEDGMEIEKLIVGRE